MNSYINLGKIIQKKIMNKNRIFFLAMLSFAVSLLKINRDDNNWIQIVQQIWFAAFTKSDSSHYVAIRSWQ